MRVELRVVVALGFAVAAWLLFVPAPHPSTGQSCGIPVAAGGRDDAGGDLPAACDDVNRTRVGQAVGTAVLAGGLVGVHALARVVREARDARTGTVAPHHAGWWDAERARQGGAR